MELSLWSFCRVDVRCEQKSRWIQGNDYCVRHRYFYPMCLHTFKILFRDFHQCVWCYWKKSKLIKDLYFSQIIAAVRLDKFKSFLTKPINLFSRRKKRCESKCGIGVLLECSESVWSYWKKSWKNSCFRIWRLLPVRWDDKLAMISWKLTPSWKIWVDELMESQKPWRNVKQYWLYYVPSMIMTL